MNMDIFYHYIDLMLFVVGYYLRVMQIIPSINKIVIRNQRHLNYHGLGFIYLLTKIFYYKIYKMKVFLN